MLREYWGRRVGHRAIQAIFAFLLTCGEVAAQQTEAVGAAEPQSQAQEPALQDESSEAVSTAHEESESEPPPVEAVSQESVQESLSEPASTGSELDGDSEQDGAPEQEAWPAESPGSVKRRPPAGPFARGTLQLGVSGGWASTFGGGESNSWIILGAGVGYFLVDGLGFDANVAAWVGDPFIVTLTPGARYVFYQVPMVKPYVGVMYRHYFINGSLPDTDSLGVRAGVNFPISSRSYFGGGVMVEAFLDDAVWSESPLVYPELGLTLAF